MSFESLSFTYEFEINNFPIRWLPLIYLYDPDLPLFPLYYFHVLNNNLAPGTRPSDTDRAFGYIDYITKVNNNTVRVSIITNKDLYNRSNRTDYQQSVEIAVKERLGINDPVVQADVNACFRTPFSGANNLSNEIWQRVVSNSYGGKLPFGKLWDEVLGITRYVSSWNSPGGRKGEFIQTHYFATKFGEKIQSSGNIPQVDFFLFPTYEELIDTSNPLSNFSNYSNLVDLANTFSRSYGQPHTFGNTTITGFTNPYRGQFNTQSYFNIINSIPFALKNTALECFNAFDKGPHRTVIFLLLLHDIRNKLFNPSTISGNDIGALYDQMSGMYQSPKVISIYAQQSHGNSNALPIDTWIETFLEWPYFMLSGGVNKFVNIFTAATNLGKLERLLWVAGQARKVHSSACNDILWCIKYSSTRNQTGQKINAKPRGANPLACNACKQSIRRVCPAFIAIQNDIVEFNVTANTSGTFIIKTSANNNTTANQHFIYCMGYGLRNGIFDDFSPADSPSSFAPYPQQTHRGGPITVDDFVRIY